MIAFLIFMLSIDYYRWFRVFPHCFMHFPIIFCWLKWNSFSRIFCAAFDLCESWLQGIDNVWLNNMPIFLLAYSANPLQLRIKYDKGGRFPKRPWKSVEKTKGKSKNKRERQKYELQIYRWIDLDSYVFAAKRFSA